MAALANKTGEMPERECRTLPCQPSACSLPCQPRLRAGRLELPDASGSFCRIPPSPDQQHFSADHESLRWLPSPGTAVPWPRSLSPCGSCLLQKEVMLRVSAVASGAAQEPVAPSCKRLICSGLLLWRVSPSNLYFHLGRYAAFFSSGMAGSSSL